MVLQPDNDLTRLQREYSRRAQNPDEAYRYSYFNPVYLYMIQQRQRDTLNLLKQKGLNTLEDRTLLEIGCGKGGVLQEYGWLGILPRNSYGVELIPDRLAIARSRLPGGNLHQVDGQSLPYRNQAFDLVLQYTVFTSILDAKIRQNIAGEMLRVLKPEGMIIWYDFWFNPTNKQTRGIKPQEIKALFADCTLTFRKVTLAPPITRQLIKISWGVCHMVERLNFLNSHYLVAIQKNH